MERAELERLARSPIAVSTALKCFYLDHPNAAWSACELGEIFGVSDRYVRKALATVRGFKEFELLEEPLEAPPVWGGQMPMRRRLIPRRPHKVQGGGPPLNSLLPTDTNPPGSDPPRLQTADPHACAHDRNATQGSSRREPATGTRRPPRAERRRLARARRREGGGFDPVVVPPDLLAALRARHGAVAVADVLAVLREPLARAHPDVAAAAARKLLDRRARVPGAVFRHLLEVERTLACERVDRERDPDHAPAVCVVGPPDPRVARARAARDRLALIADGHPHRAALAAELAALERDLEVSPPPPPVRRMARAKVWVRRWSELGPRTGVVVDAGGGRRAVVHVPHDDPADADRALRAHFEALDEAALDALDRDEPPPLKRARLAAASSTNPNGTVPP